MICLDSKLDSFSLFLSDSNFSLFLSDSKFSLFLSDSNFSLFLSDSNKPYNRAGRKLQMFRRFEAQVNFVL